MRVWWILLRHLGFVPEERQDCTKTPGCDPNRWPKPDVTGGQSSEGEHQEPAREAREGEEGQAEELFHFVPFS